MYPKFAVRQIVRLKTQQYGNPWRVAAIRGDTQGFVYDLYRQEATPVYATVFEHHIRGLKPGKIDLTPAPAKTLKELYEALARPTDDP